MARGRPQSKNSKEVPLQQAFKDNIIKAERYAVLSRINQSYLDNPNQTFTALSKTFGVSKQVASAAARGNHLICHLRRAKANQNSPKKKAMKSRVRLATKAAGAFTVASGARIPKNPGAKQIAAVIKQKTGETVSVSTVKRALRAGGLQNLVRKKQTFNTEKIAERKAFIDWAKRELQKDALFLDRIVYSDETWIHAMDKTSRTMWAASKMETFPRINIKKINSIRTMAWAMIGYNFKSPMEFVHTIRKKRFAMKKQGGGRKAAKKVVKKKSFNGKDLAEGETDSRTMNAEEYQQLITPSLELLKPIRGKKRFFQQDGATCHTAASTTAFIAEKKQLVLPVKWPADSPDLNMIENVWSLFQGNLAIRMAEKGRPKTEKALEAMARKVWDEIPQETINAFVRHMNKVVEEFVV